MPGASAARSGGLIGLPGVRARLVLVADAGQPGSGFRQRHPHDLGDRCAVRARRRSPVRPVHRLQHLSAVRSSARGADDFPARRPSDGDDHDREHRVRAATRVRVLRRRQARCGPTRGTPGRAVRARNPDVRVDDARVRPRCPPGGDGGGERVGDPRFAPLRADRDVGAGRRFVRLGAADQADVRRVPRRAAGCRPGSRGLAPVAWPGRVRVLAGERRRPLVRVPLPPAPGLLHVRRRLGAKCRPGSATVVGQKCRLVLLEPDQRADAGRVRGVLPDRGG